MTIKVDVFGFYGNIISHVILRPVIVHRDADVLGGVISSERMSMDQYFSKLIDLMLRKKNKKVVYSEVPMDGRVWSWNKMTIIHFFIMNLILKDFNVITAGLEAVTHQGFKEIIFRDLLGSAQPKVKCKTVSSNEIELFMNERSKAASLHV